MRACKRCGKSFTMGGTRKQLRSTKFNPTGWGKKRANLQWTKLLEPGKRSRVCTKCIRTLSKSSKTKK